MAGYRNPGAWRGHGYRNVWLDTHGCNFNLHGWVTVVPPGSCMECHYLHPSFWHGKGVLGAMTPCTAVSRAQGRFWEKRKETKLFSYYSRCRAISVGELKRPHIPILASLFSAWDNQAISRRKQAHNSRYFYSRQSVE